MLTTIGRVVAPVAMMLVACGGSQGPQDKKALELSDQPPVTYETPAGKQAPLADGPAHLELAEITVFQAQTPVFKIHADGSTEVSDGSGWQKGPTIKVDGTLVHEGQAVARANPDGTLVNLRNGETLPIKITSDSATMEQGGKKVGVSLSAEGALTIIGDKQPPQPIRVEGATTPGKRKTVLVFMAALMPSGKQDAPATGSGP